MDSGDVKHDWMISFSSSPEKLAADGNNCVTDNNCFSVSNVCKMFFFEDVIFSCGHRCNIQCNISVSNVLKMLFF